MTPLGILVLTLGLAALAVIVYGVYILYRFGQL